jgi:hypothetical protein
LPGTGRVDDTPFGSEGGRLFGGGRFRKFWQAETPRLPLAVPDRMAGNFPATRHLQQSPGPDPKEFGGSVSIHKMFNVGQRRRLWTCSMARPENMDFGQ